MKLCRYLAVVALLGCAAGCASRPAAVFQYSTINALLAGVYDGDLTIEELRRQGDFGLGTFNALDGEMVALDGRYYQIKSDGSVRRVADTVRTPFAVVTFFRPTRAFSVPELGSFAALEQELEARLPAKNVFHAIKITGRFASVKARSVPRQQPPYVPLVEASKQQAIFELQDVSGTLVGFRTPAFVQGLNVPGYHFHFLSADRRVGGHVLDCRLRAGQVAVATVNDFYMSLPRRGAFGEIDMARPRDKELEAVEKGH